MRFLPENAEDATVILANKEISEPLSPEIEDIGRKIRYFINHWRIITPQDFRVNDKSKEAFALSEIRG
jgi:hypothetical protein